MRHNIHRYTRATEAPASENLSQAPYYEDKLLPELQHALAALADLELRFEIVREAVEALCESEEERQHHRAELEQVHQNACEPLFEHLARLQAKAKPVH